MDPAEQKTGKKYGVMIRWKWEPGFADGFIKREVPMFPVLVTYVMKSKKPCLRIGLTTSKKIGSAVQRNRSPQGDERSVPADCAGRENRIWFCFCSPGKNALCKMWGREKGDDKAAERGGSFQMKRPLIWLIRFYQRAISPLSRPCCKYYPTCSNYGLQAIERFGRPEGRAADPLAHFKVQSLLQGRLRPGARKEGKTKKEK